MIGILLLISFIYIYSFTGSQFTFNFIKEKPSSNKCLLFTKLYCWLNFFITVAATNLFHQGNWQRVYAAKNFKTLKQSLIISFFIIIPIVFYMGFSGIVAFSIDQNIRPDLGFFIIT